ncbi:MAG: V-type ATPase subunit [Erysipelotrichaceae bacterium]
MDFATGALASKAKAMYGRMLKQQNYEELLRKKSVSEIAYYLKNETDYAEVLSDVHETTLHRGQLENLMHRYIFEKTMRLVRFAGTAHASFYSSFIIPEESEQILNQIRLLNSDLYEEFAQDVPLYLNKFTSFDLMKLHQTKNFNEMLTVLKGTGFDLVIKPFAPVDGKIIDYTACDLALRNYYYVELRNAIDKNFKGSIKKELKTILNTQIELENINRIYRFKKFFTQEIEPMRDSLTKIEDRFSQRFMETLMAAPNSDVFLQLLADSPYHFYFDEKEFVFIEYDCERIKYNLSNRYMRFSNNAPLVFTVYLVLLSIEVNNLITIIEGVRYKVPVENISKMLIYTKGGA